MSFTDADLDAAINALSQPGRQSLAQELVSRTAPNLERVLGGALQEGGWFDTAHQAAVTDALGMQDPEQRLTAVRTLFAEETRLSMLVGVAVGFELARELGYTGDGSGSQTATDRKE